MFEISDKELEERIKYICKKYRDELFGEIERNLCIDHYNDLFGLQVTVDDIETKLSRCRFCNEEKICVVHPLKEKVN